MTEIEIYQWCQSQVLIDKLLEIPDYFYSELDTKQATLITNYFPKTTLFKLPSYEIDFFEWVKKEDRYVWDDLWSDELHPPYVVSLIFFPILIKHGYRGFPICDLVNSENHYFAPAHLADRESEIFTESSKTRFVNKETLTVPQLLAIEISMDPIDLWHFAYKHKIDLVEAKKAVNALVNDDVLVHLKESEYLANFIDL